MSKRHQSSRRRTYGRRQHELHERPDRGAEALGLLEESDVQEPLHRWGNGLYGREAGDGWLRGRGLD